MKSIWSAIADIFRRWRYVEDDEPGNRASGSTPASDELQRLKNSLAGEERKLADFRQFNCDALARHCEASIRNLRSRISVLEGYFRQAS